MTEDLPPLPEPAGAIDVDKGPAGSEYMQGARLIEVADGYSAEQMHAYALPLAVALRALTDAVHEGRLVPVNAKSRGYTNSVVEQAEAALSSILASRQQEGRDAARYRALRAQNHSMLPRLVDPFDDRRTYLPEGLDAAIDAAISAEGKS